MWVTCRREPLSVNSTQNALPRVNVAVRNFVLVGNFESGLPELACPMELRFGRFIAAQRCLRNNKPFYPNPSILRVAIRSNSATIVRHPRSRHTHLAASFSKRICLELPPL